MLIIQQTVGFVIEGCRANNDLKKAVIVIKLFRPLLNKRETFSTI